MAMLSLSYTNESGPKPWPTKGENMINWLVTYLDQDKNRKTLTFNAENLGYAMKYADDFCNRLGFQWETIHRA